MTIEVVKLNLFIDRLIQAIESKNSRICVGLDPHLNHLPDHLIEQEKVGKAENRDDYLQRMAQVIVEFNKEIINQVAPYTAVVKPQMAFYEQLGLPGLEALQATVTAAKEAGLLVILDGKRNDIGSSAAGYQLAYLMKDYSKSKEFQAGFFQVDALTINPYLGWEGIKPFLVNEESGVFALLRTSNPGAAELQGVSLASGEKYYQFLGEKLQEWGKDYLGNAGYSNLGAVVGATCPEELVQLREALPRVFFLIPGYGAQGGGAVDVVGGFDGNLRGGIVNSARSIIFAYQQKNWRDKYKPKDFALAAGEAALQMRDDINLALSASEGER
ncbi:MAG: orotidine-5'-phosphate decarboxylase [Bacillota bacterium]